jgi:hypothetical protein
MTYTPGTPQPQTIPSSDQDDFVENFQLLNQFFGADHIPFTAISGNGNHKKVTLNANLNTGPMFPGSGIFPNSSAVYTKKISVTSKDPPDLYFQNNIGATFEKLVTSLRVIKGDGANGFGMVTPWGIIINFGMVNDPDLNLTFDFPVPYTTEVYSIVNCGVDFKDLPGAQQFSYANIVSLTQFISRTTTITNAFGFATWYMAVGK